MRCRASAWTVATYSTRAVQFPGLTRDGVRPLTHLRHVVHAVDRSGAEPRRCWAGHDRLQKAKWAYSAENGPEKSPSASTSQGSPPRPPAWASRSRCAAWHTTTRAGPAVCRAVLLSRTAGSSHDRCGQDDRKAPANVLSYFAIAYQRGGPKDESHIATSEARLRYQTPSTSRRVYFIAADSTLG